MRQLGRGYCPAGYIVCRPATTAAAEARLAPGDLRILDWATRRPFDEYYRAWLDSYVKAHCKDATYEVYETGFRLYLEPAFGKRGIGELSREDVTRLALDHHRPRTLVLAEARRAVAEARLDALDPQIRRLDLMAVRVDHAPAGAHRRGSRVVAGPLETPGDRLAPRFARSRDVRDRSDLLIRAPTATVLDPPPASGVVSWNAALRGGLHMPLAQPVTRT